MLDADGGDVGHHGEQVEIVFRELAKDGGRIDIDDADDFLARLQRHGNQAADVLFDDALALAQSFIVGGVADQHGRAGIDHAIADGSGDTETFAAISLRDKLAVFERQKNAAVAFDRVDGEFENEAEKFRQRTVAGEFIAGADECGHLRGSESLAPGRFGIRLLSPSRRHA